MDRKVAVLENQKTKTEGDLMKPLRWVFAQKHPVLAFLLISFAWSWLFWFAAIPFRGQPLLVMPIVFIGGYGPAIGGILTLGLRSGLQLDPSPKKTVTLVIASLVIFALISLQYLVGNIPNYETLAENLTLLTTALIVAVVLTASLVGGWVISSAVSSNADIRARMASILPWRLPLGWTVVALLFYPVMILAAWGLASLLGADVEYPRSWASSALNGLPLFVLAFGFTFLVSGGPEEIGWRGLMQPELQKRFSPLVAALIITVFWVLWHLPLYLNGFRPGDLVSGMISQGIMGVFLAIFLAWFYNRSGGNLFLMMFLHTGFNRTANLLPASAAPGLLLFWLIVVVAVVVKDKMRRKLPEQQR